MVHEDPGTIGKMDLVGSRVWLKHVTRVENAPGGAKSPVPDDFDYQ